MDNMPLLDKNSKSGKRFFTILHSNAVEGFGKTLVLMLVEEIIKIFKTISELEKRIKALEPKPRSSISDEKFTNDVFVSYSHKDEDWVKNVLLPRLEREGIKVCIDFRDFELGVPIITNILEATINSQKTLLILTPNYLKSEWAEFEQILTQSSDPAARNRRLIPVLQENCEVPFQIRGLTYADLSRPEISEYQFDKLINSIKK